MKILKNQKGSTMLECTMLMSLVALALLTQLTETRGDIEESFTEADKAIGGGTIINQLPDE